MSEFVAKTKLEFKLGMATREAFGRSLAELGKENQEIVVLDADLSKSTYTHLFAKEFPERFFSCGISEANMVSIAAGLAASGKIPFVSSFACFLICKGFDQFRMSVAYPGFNVKAVGTHSGISIGEDGPSQQGIEDIALVCALPGMIVAAPADEVATRALVQRAVEHKGPVYLRTGRPKAPILYSNEEDFRFGVAKKLADGTDVAVLAYGLEVAEALKAADICQAEGISVRVLDVHTIKPLDEEAILSAARECGAIVTAEEHLLDGGFGSRVAALVGEHCPAPLERIGIRDTYAESGTPAELMDKYGLTAPHIVAAIRRVLKKK
jgi:transketolase